MPRVMQCKIILMNSPVRADLLSHQRLHLRLSRGECRLVLVDTIAAVIIGTIRALVLAILVSRGGQR